MFSDFHDCTNFTGLSGIYSVIISDTLNVVYCDLLTPGGGWLVIDIIIIKYNSQYKSQYKNI